MNLLRPAFAHGAISLAAPTADALPASGGQPDEARRVPGCVAERSCTQILPTDDMDILQGELVLSQPWFAWSE